MLEPLPANRDTSRAPTCNVDGFPVLMDGMLSALFALSGIAIAAIEDDPNTAEVEGGAGTVIGGAAIGLAGGGFFLYSALRGRRLNARCHAAWADFGTDAPR